MCPLRPVECLLLRPRICAVGCPHEVSLVHESWNVRGFIPQVYMIERITGRDGRFLYARRLVELALMSWREKSIELGERVAGTWCGGASRDAREYLATNGMGFVQDIARVTGMSSLLVREQVEELLQETWGGMVALRWPEVSPVTTFYYVRRLQETQELERWANRAVDFYHGVTPGFPVIANVATYAAHVGHTGRAIAGLIMARQSRRLAEVAIPDPWSIGLSPVYHLPSFAYRHD